jgi:hypothetical protein
MLCTIQAPGNGLVYSKPTFACRPLDLVTLVCTGGVLVGALARA